MLTGGKNKNTHTDNTHSVLCTVLITTLYLTYLFRIRHRSANFNKNRCTVDSLCRSSLALTSSLSLANNLSLSSSTDFRSAFSYTQIQKQHISRHSEKCTEMFNLKQSGLAFPNALYCKPCPTLSISANNNVCLCSFKSDTLAA